MTTSGRPILVTGSIRSGTTWVGRILAAAPGVVSIHEPFNVDHQLGVFAHCWERQYTHVTETSALADEVAGALADTLAFRYRPFVHLRHPQGLLRALGMTRDLPRSWYRRHLSRPRPVLKDPIALFSAEWLERKFDMDVVVMVRHPGAFAWSYIRIGERNRLGDLLAQKALLEGPLASHADEVARAARSDDVIVQAGTLWRATYAMVDAYRARNPAWLIRRHEDLSMDPLGEFTDLMSHLDLPFTSRVRRLLEATTNPANPVEAPPGVLHQLRRDSRSNISVWQRRLDPGDVARLRTLTEGVVDGFYSSASWWRPPVDEARTLARSWSTTPSRSPR